MTVESQIKLWGNGIFYSGRLITLCCWAQQSKLVDKVLKAQFQTFEPMHTYDFLIMVYCFLGGGLLKASFTVKKSIICIPIVIYTHTYTRSIINSSLLGSKYRGHRSGCDKLPRDSNVSFLAYKIAIFVLLMVLQFTPVNSCMVWLYSVCTGQDKIQKVLALEASSIPWHLVNPRVVLMFLISTFQMTISVGRSTNCLSEWQTICRSSSQLFQIWGRDGMVVGVRCGVGWEVSSDLRYLLQ